MSLDEDRGLAFGGVPIFFALLVILYFAIQVVLSPQDAGLSFFLLLAIQISPIFILSYLGRFQFLMFFCFGQFLFYSFPLVLEFLTLGLVPVDRLEEIQELVICDLLIIATSTLLNVIFINSKKEAPIFIEVSEFKKISVLVFVLAYPSLAPFVPYVTERIFGGLYFALLIFGLSFEKGRPFLNLGIKCILVATLGVGVLNSGFLGFAYLVGLYLFFYALAKRKMGFAILCVLLGGTFFIFQPIKGMYRAMTWGNSNIGFFEKAHIFKELISGVYFGSANLEEYGFSTEVLEMALEGGYSQRLRDLAEENDGFQGGEEEVGLFKSSVVGSSSRLGDDSLKRVLRLSGSSVPFMNGKTYENLLYALVPRFLWPDKPTWNLGGEFGHKFEYLSDDDNITSIAFNFLAEGYMNYGYLGLYVVAVIYGGVLFLFNFLAKKVWGGFYFPVFFVVGINFLTFNIEMLGLLQSLLLAVLICMGLRHVFVERRPVEGA